MRNDVARPANTVQIFLRHHKDPEGRFKPKEKSCQDFEDRNGHLQKGCGGAVVRFLTYPREKGIYFDAPGPIVVQEFPIRQDGAIIAVVKNENVHFATCTARAHKDPATNDFRSAAAGTAGE